jgi:2-methylcitrate dehydratase PrpD
MTLAQDLARRIVGTHFEALTPAAIRSARMGILDTLAVGIAGAKEDAALIARKVAGRDHTNALEWGSGAALVWGTGNRTSALEAAFLNGIAANVLDFDDCTDALGGHPSAPILPALIALAEERRASGRDVLVAYVAGFETETALGRGVNFHHYEKGWHPTATLGVFGAAAACARLIGLDAENTARALALCASLACGVKSNLGSMGKPMHVGQCSRSGLLAVLLAAEGFTGNADAIEHHQGFLEVFNGAGHYDAARIVEKWGAPWEIEWPGIAIKQYPCCLSTQSSVDLMLDLVRSHDLAPDRVARVSATFAARRLEHTNRPQPRSALDAKLSAQYVLARALTDRTVGLPHFEGEAFRDARVRDAMSRIEVRTFDDSTLERLGDFGAAIEVELADGRTLSGSIGRPVGHEPGNPLSPELLKAKFESCVSSLARSQADALYECVQRFDALADVRELTATFEMRSSEPLRASA